VDFSAIGTDIHSHLLPGIDDGAADAGQSMELIKGLQELGYRKFITTPHIFADMYPNTPDTIQQAHQHLLQAAGSLPSLQYAAEYFLDETFDQLLQEGKPLLCLHGKMILVEFSFVTTPINFKQELFELQIRGYQPVLAHPERYLYFGNARHLFDELRDAGCLFACNILSFTGYYGKGAMELAGYLVKKDQVDLLGTDIHHARHLQALRNAHAVMPVVQKLADAGRLLNPRL